MQWREAIGGGTSMGWVFALIALAACSASHPDKAPSAGATAGEAGEGLEAGGAGAPALDAAPAPTGRGVDGGVLPPMDAAADTAVADAAAPADAASSPGPTEVLFDVLTKPVSSDFGSRNVGAIWVEDADGRPIKALEVWGGINRVALTTFNMTELVPIGGFPRTAPPDVMTSATQARHITHHARWDLTDRNGVPVAAGGYAIFIEVADNRETTVVASVPFDKGPMPVVIQRPDTTEFGPMMLTYR